jgi:hypothetical protein
MRGTIVTLTMVLAVFNSAKSEILTPSATTYDFDSYHDAGLYSCAMELEITSFPSPEAATVRLDLTRNFTNSSNPGAQALMTVTVADIILVPKTIAPVKLVSASFESQQFNSAGRMESHQRENGGILALSTTAASTMDFISAFILGQFQISFVREGQTGTRTYKIEEGPSVEVVDKFAKCSTVLLQNAP